MKPGNSYVLKVKYKNQNNETKQKLGGKDITDEFRQFL